MICAPTAEQLADEARRARKVRQLVDIATALIMQSNMTVDDAELLVQTVRERILGLFPDGGDTYELIYAPRFRQAHHGVRAAPSPGCRDPVPERRV
jgi:hypothetical protein